MTIKDALEWGSYELLEMDSCRLDAELLLAHVLKARREYLMTRDDLTLNSKAESSFRKLISQRKKHCPVAYLVGHKAFYGLDFEVNKHVLIPRPDTEILVEGLLSYLKTGDLLLDVGTGSGCIPIAALKNKLGVNAVATDHSRAALKVAQRNVKAHALEHRVQLIHSNLLRDVDLSLFEGDSLVVSANLPYVPHDYQINDEAKFEPSLALFADNNGVELYERLLQQLMPVQPRAIFLECYEFQIALLAEHFKTYRLKWSQSALGNARVLFLKRDCE